MFHDDWEKDFDKTANSFFKVGIAIWAVSLIGSLIVLGVGVWAAIEIVNWLVSK